MRLASGLYRGTVVHARARPRRHRLRYRSVMMLLDLDELPALGARLRLFAHNRAGLLSFHDKDHGDGSGDLRGWAGRALRSAGIEPDGGAIRILCMPRVLGRAFNPLSVWFCHRRDGALGAIIYEVRNTFGERHSYVIAAGGGPGLVKQSCAKRFYVSPLMDMDLTYDFTIRPPGRAVSVVVAARDGEGPVLSASFAGRRRALTDRALLGVWLRFPLLAAQVVGAIHWQALKIWLKGIKLRPRPAPPTVEFSGPA